MNQTFNKEELKNILALISLAPITGKEAVTVAVLQQKIAEMLASLPAVEDKEVAPKE